VETNLEQQTPKLNVTNVSSAVFGKDGPALGEESKIGKLSRIVRTTRLKVNEVEKSITGISAKFLEIDKKITLNTENITGNTKKTETNADKITRLKKILQNQKSDIGKKLPDSTEKKDKAQLNTTLSETNRILVEIQKQLAQDFGAREQEAKEESEESKEATSKQRFKREETALEKSAKSIVSTAKKATKKVVSPLGNIFEKILAFIGILGKGIALNAAFAWFQDPENQKKLKKFFNILKENWKLLAKILLTIGGAILVGKIIGFISAISGLVGFIMGPLAVAMALVLATATSTAEYDQITGPNAVYADPRLGKGKDFEVDQNPISRIFGDQNSKEAREGRARTRITLIEGIFARKKFEDWDPMAQLKYDEAVNFLKLDKDKLLERLEPQRQYGAAFRKYQAGDGPLPGQEPTIEFLTDKNIAGFRELGGPVTAGRTYLVGEKGPELFSPNIDGSIVNNMRTEKIYQMLASGKRGRTRIVNLPPQVIEGPKPEVNVNQGPATQAPRILSSNPFDGSRLVTPEIYGISV